MGDSLSYLDNLLVESVITKSDEREAGARFVITSMITD